MCLAIMQPINKKLTHDQIMNAWTRNPDNAGFAYVDDKGTININKYDNMIDFINYYFQYVDLYGNKSPFLVHFRLATHGKVDLNNTHPFYVNKELAMIHNGIIDIKIPKKQRHLSDTRYFIESVLKQLPKNWIHNKALRDLINYRINYDNYVSNKLVFLTYKRETFIIGEQAGIWHGGMWFSNGGFKTPTELVKSDPSGFTLDGTTMNDTDRMFWNEVLTDLDRDYPIDDLYSDNFETVNEFINNVLAIKEYE